MYQINFFTQIYSVYAKGNKFVYILICVLYKFIFFYTYIIIDWNYL